MEFTFVLTLEESQKVLDALVKEPYISVVEVINKIQLQANKQIQENNNNNDLDGVAPDKKV